MLHGKARFLIILLFLVLGVVLHVKLGIGGAWYLYLASLVLLITHFLFGNVWAAFSLLKKGRLGDAEKMIDGIKKPNWLLKGHRAYFHFIKGIIALQDKAFNESETHLTNALSLGLRSSNDSALVYLNLAHLCFAQKRKMEAKNYLTKAKALPFNDLMLKDKIAEMEKVLN